MSGRNRWFLGFAVGATLALVFASALKPAHGHEGAVEPQAVEACAICLAGGSLEAAVASQHELAAPSERRPATTEPVRALFAAPPVASASARAPPGAALSS